ncbi:MAG: PIN domain-containing protein [Myxococcaceae bacterium]|nr:PIN domain-containing protein [Myxococcaceae bacterium]
MSDAALICDTGALLDYLDRSAPDHRAFRRAIDRARARYVPGLVLAEVDSFLRDDRAAMRALTRDLSSGAFTLAPVELTSIERAMEIDRRFAALELGLVDASVVALAEQLDVVRLATRDIADFSAVRLRDGSAFEMVVVPRR